MNNHQHGFGGLQVIMVVAVIAAVSVIAVPKYNSFITKSKITEAFTIASESKRKLSEFYMVNSRFPQTAGEAEAMKTVTLSPPEYVRGMAVEPGYQSHDVAVMVYLKDGVVDNETGAEQFIYITGDKSTNSGFEIEWNCGASGIGAELLPENCQG